MNGKQCKRIRKWAMTKAHSQNDTTLEGVHARKIEGYENDVSAFDGAINIAKGHFVQRKLHKMSLKKLSKDMKAKVKQTPNVSHTEWIL